MLWCGRHFRVAVPEAPAADKGEARLSGTHDAEGLRPPAGDAAPPSREAGVATGDAGVAAAASVGEDGSAESGEDDAARRAAADDLEWAPEDIDPESEPCITTAIEAGRSLSRTLTEVSRRFLTDIESSPASVPEEREEACHRVQVHFDNGWQDFNDEESRRICDELAEGRVEFSLHFRGHEYMFNFSKVSEATQTNVKTGKRRKLRIIEGDDTAVVADLPGDLAEEIRLQKALGPQSKRGSASQSAIGKYLDGNPHARTCFEQFEQNELKYCSEWAVFYHSYSFAALIYEVHAAVASVLFRFRSQYSALPRILVHEFLEIPDAGTLIQRFNTDFAEHKRDHNPGFRKVGISAMCSLASTGPEACVARVFVSGYSCKDVSFRSVLENVLEACYVPKENVTSLATKIIKLSEKHSLDVSQFGGRACQSAKPGHLMQVFIKRSLVDQLVYAAEPYGPVDTERMPVSRYVNSDANFNRGQVRIVAHPKYFMQANLVRLFVASADPTFHKSRATFQKELIELIKELAEPSLRERAAAGIYGGTLPSWWTAEDQRQRA